MIPHSFDSGSELLNMWSSNVADVWVICVGSVISGISECVDVALWEVWFSRLIFRSPMNWISSALLSDLLDEIFFRRDSIISVNLMISEFGGLYTLPINLNFFDETLTFKNSFLKDRYIF